MALAQKSSVAARMSTRRAGVVRASVARKAVVVRASTQQETSKSAVMSAALVSSTAAALANPMVAEAAVTPSLNNFLGSLVAGGVVLAAIAGALTLVSGFDPVNRG